MFELRVVQVRTDSNHVGMTVLAIGKASLSLGNQTLIGIEDRCMSVPVVPDCFLSGSKKTLKLALYILFTPPPLSNRRRGCFLVYTGSTAGPGGGIARDLGTLFENSLVS